MNNTCPRPQGQMLRQLIEDAADTLREVVASNPSFSFSQSVEWTLDGISEGWELASDFVEALRKTLNDPMALAENSDQYFNSYFIHERARMCQRPIVDVVIDYINDDSTDQLSSRAVY